MSGNGGNALVVVATPTIPGPRYARPVINVGSHPTTARNRADRKLDYFMLPVPCHLRVTPCRHSDT
jgi:hypothetical protein